MAREDEEPEGFKPLDGIRVLDFTKILAGPLCTQYLADLGADVIKVEPLTGDDTRDWPPFEDGVGAIFMAVNRNKRGIALDLRKPEGLAVAHQLARAADIAIESFGPGVADRLNVGWQALSSLNPRLVYASISGYGTQGPMKDGKGYDLIAQAFTGMLSLTGEPGGPPARSPFSPVDQATGLHAVIGILGALRQRDRNGQGVRIETSLFDSAVGFLGYFLQNYWQRGTEPQRPGSGHESLCPYQSFPTADAPIILGIANDAFWRAFCDLIDEPGLATDVRFATNSERVAHRDTLVPMVAEFLTRRTRAEWLSALTTRGIPSSPVHTLGELSAHAHTEQSGMILHNEGFRTVASPIRVDGARLDLRTRPPALGEHSRRVLCELGFTNDKIDTLIAEGVVGSTATTAPLDVRRES
ncbi:CoA transferase [Sphingomonas glacialis]|uniref:CoA transferase n=1 Tax=Sphingomonas glacialis TaxID=658225 RepID=A0ABQ3LRA4_9SPHN|nr:CoA transferase [Sphingomonas glacialis]GHH24024.1 CoA transferase [Sphingomonas glacialis]